MGNDMSCLNEMCVPSFKMVDWEPCLQTWLQARQFKKTGVSMFVAVPERTHTSSHIHTRMHSPPRQTETHTHTTSTMSAAGACQLSSGTLVNYRHTNALSHTYTLSLSHTHTRTHTHRHSVSIRILPPVSQKGGPP